MTLSSSGPKTRIAAPGRAPDLARGVAIAFALLAGAGPVVADPSRQSCSLLVEKAKRELHLLCDGSVHRTFPIALGFTPEGPKRCEGDGKTPEGSYRIAARNPGSDYHYALRVSYPSVKDQRLARDRGCTPGGDIMLHGAPNKVPEWLLGLYRIFKPDWTRGCIALANRDLDDVAAMTPDGASIEIRP
jgi:murein L,D-transpeptidase YafK